MATTSDVDVTSAVRKFLERDVVVDREDESNDTSEEVRAILESVAVSFLLYPQTALSFVLMAKNTVQQILTADLSVIDFLLKAVDDVDNPDEVITDTSDPIEAQTALVEVDRLGRLGTEVKAYGRYTAAIDRFLNKDLAKSLKRRRRSEFERTGTEAKQDIFSTLPTFGAAHSLMSTFLGLLYNSVGNFSGIDLTRVVSTKTVARVRSSLRRVLQGVQDGSLSNTAVAVELLSGAAALTSISNVRKIYDPAIDTGTFPINRTIRASSETVGAQAQSIEGPFDLSSLSTPWVFSLTTDPEIGGGKAFSVTLPCVGGSGRVWLVAGAGQATYAIPVDQNILYVQFDGPTPPMGASTTIRAVTLPTGTVTLAAILLALNNVTTGLINGTAIELAPGTGRVMIYGSAEVTRITVLGAVAGTFDGGSNYVPATLSVHSILGFDDDQLSKSATVFAAGDLADILGAWVTTASFTDTESASGSQAGALLVASSSTALLSSLLFSGAVATKLGFALTTYEVEPGYLELLENGSAVDPLSVGVYVGSLMTVADVNPIIGRNLSSLVTSINGTQLFFDGRLPRCSLANVQSTAPIIFAIQKLLAAIKPYVGTFDGDALDFQRVLNPLLSRPTLAQMNDAKKVMQVVRDRLDALRTQVTQILVRDDRCQYAPVAKNITTALEERGLDRALEFLERGQFSDFFTLTTAVASKGGRFLTALEQVGRQDYATTTIESDMQDLEPTATTPEDDHLRGQELSSG